ncbi:hypothetical protein N8865_00830 [Francisellaceae bacterium]|nr:hypothetical protein [Francisellaceae bacterium]
MLTVSTVIKLISKNIVFDIISSAFFKKFISSGVGEKVAIVSEFALASGITGLYKFEAMQIHSMKAYVWLSQNDPGLGHRLVTRNIDTLFFFVFKDLAPFIKGKSK